MTASLTRSSRPWRDADYAFFDDVDPLGSLERQRDVLLDEQDGDVSRWSTSMICRIWETCAHQTFCRLIQQNDFGLEHHRARDREHLLLATRQGATRLVAPLGQHREILVDLFQELLFSGFVIRGDRDRCGGFRSPSGAGKSRVPRERSRCRASPADERGSWVTGRPSNSTSPWLGWRDQQWLQGSCSCRRRLRREPTTSALLTSSETPCKIWLLP